MDSLGEWVWFVWVSHQIRYLPRSSSVMSRGGGGGVLDGVLCDGNMVKDTPRVVPPGEL